MTQTVFIANPQGLIIDEVSVDLDPVSWRLSKVGGTRLGIVLGDDKASEDNFRFGNRVLIEFDNGLPNWGGVIDTPRDWQPGRLIATAYSGEYLFYYRGTGKVRAFQGATAGTIFKTLIQDANAFDDVGLSEGEVWGGGFHFNDSYHFENLLKIIQDKLCGKLSTAEFSVTAQQENGRIDFRANLYDRRGGIKTELYLEEAANVSEYRLVEQGPLINWWDVAGQDLDQGNDWGPGRLTAHAHDQESWGTFGLRMGGEVLSNAKELGEVQAVAESNLKKTKDPHNMVSLTVSNSDPAGFEDYDVGDVVTAKLPSVGFGGYEAPVRIIAREYDPATGLCDLVLQEWFGE